MTDAVKSDDVENRGYGFHGFEKVAVDSVLAIAYNNAGNRIGLASADHKLRVYCQTPTRDWTLFDQWRGHDAEILNASRSTLRTDDTC